MVEARDPPSAQSTVGRYAVHGEFASGGMATVHFGHLLGPAGFTRLVAIKRMRPEIAKDPEFVTMFLDEAWLAARVQHPNVVATLDIVAEQGELFLVMEFVRGLSLATLWRITSVQNQHIPVEIALAVLVGALEGLHAVHEAKGENDKPLEIIHRDVSPQNILVGSDGSPRIMDFGVAKAASRLHVTTNNQLKGKVGYMAPEQLSARPVDRRADVFAAGVVLWETLAERRRFSGETFEEVMGSILSTETPPLAGERPDVTPAIDAVIAKATHKDPAQRYATALDLAAALEGAHKVASKRELAAWLAKIGGRELDAVERHVKWVEAAAGKLDPQGDPSGFAEESTYVDSRFHSTTGGLRMDLSGMRSGLGSFPRPKQSSDPLFIGGPVPESSLVTSSSPVRGRSLRPGGSHVRRWATIGAGGALLLGGGVLIGRLAGPSGDPAPAGAISVGLGPATTAPTLQSTAIQTSAPPLASSSAPAPAVEASAIPVEAIATSTPNGKRQVRPPHGLPSTKPTAYLPEKP